jgi:hypothetical protein
MATIELSSGFMASLPTRIIRYNENVNSGNVGSVTGLLMNGSESYGYPTAYITLMKGAVPADLSTLTSFTSRSADTLVTFSMASAHFAPSQTALNPAIISTIYVNASAAGTATWFWWTARPRYSFDSPNSIIHQVVGTVGTVGSGSDLEMGTTSIVAGEPYRIVNLRLQFPAMWTY